MQVCIVCQQLTENTEDTVAPEKLLQLAHSEELKNLLYNPHLRNFLQAIDVAPNAWKAMQAAMQEPLFLEFADECLKIVEPPNVEENLIDEEFMAGKYSTN
uniref:Zinc finger HIT domain-containing protein n=1 Tax=Glossina brevipalpis TaxID=37001 RepID=A0A1A9WT51_9MUSC